MVAALERFFTKIFFNRGGSWQFVNEALRFSSYPMLTYPLASQEVLLLCLFFIIFIILLIWSPSVVLRSSLTTRTNSLRIGTKQSVFHFMTIAFTDTMATFLQTWARDLSQTLVGTCWNFDLGLDLKMWARLGPSIPNVPLISLLELVP